MARKGRADRPPSHAPAVGSLPHRRESRRVRRCVLNGCPGLGGAWCSCAAAWGGLQQCEPCVCRGDLRTSGPSPCEQGSHCRPLKILLHWAPEPWNFLPGEFRRGSALDFLDLCSPHPCRAAQPQGDSEGLGGFLQGLISKPGTGSGVMHSPLLSSANRLCHLGQVTSPL